MLDHPGPSVRVVFTNREHTTTMSLPNDRHYSDAHVWLMADGEDLLLGITEHAQDSLGTIETLSLPDVGMRLSAGQICGSLESLKTVSDLIAPIAATVIEQNAAALQEPGLINAEPYDGAWLVRLSEFDKADLAQLMDAESYKESIGA